MPRLPQPGSDNGTWGDILNEYLSQSLKPDGKIKDNAVTANNLAPNSVTNSALASNAVNATIIADGSITEALLDAALQAKVNAGSAVSSVAGKTGTVTLDKSDVGLGSVDNTSDADKPISIAAQAALNAKVTKTVTPARIYGVNGDGLDAVFSYGSSVAASSFVRRDSSGRAQFSDPSASADVATKSYVDTADAAKQAKFMTGTVATAAGTTAKTVTLDSPWTSYAPIVGDFFLITFTNGNSTGSPTLAINGGSAIPLISANGSNSGAYHILDAGAAMLYRYDGAQLRHFFGLNEISTVQIVDTVNGTQGMITGRRAETLMVNEATKARTLTNKTIDLTSNALNGTASQWNAAMSDAKFVTAKIGASKNTLNGYPIIQNPEDSVAFSHLTPLINDLAFNVLRGGSVAVTRNGSVVTQPNDNWFAPDGTYTNFAVASGDTFVIEVTFNPNVSATYTTWYGVLSPGSWGAKDCALEMYDSVAASWISLGTRTNDGTGYHSAVSGSSGNGGANPVTKMRFTLSNFGSNALTYSSFRITSLFMMRYNSPLLSAGFMDRGGGDLYGTTAAAPVLRATGGDPNIDLVLRAKGGGAVTVRQTGDTADRPVVTRRTSVPSSATDTGIAGQIAYDANYIYICTAINTWKRSPLSSW